MIVQISLKFKYGCSIGLDPSTPNNKHKAKNVKINDL